METPERDGVCGSAGVGTDSLTSVSEGTPIVDSIFVSANRFDNEHLSLVNVR